jgi:hypothetical protein
MRPQPLGAALEVLACYRHQKGPTLVDFGDDFVNRGCELAILWAFPLLDFLLHIPDFNLIKDSTVVISNPQPGNLPGQRVVVLLFKAPCFYVNIKFGKHTTLP